jgi:hypothetical protein
MVVVASGAADGVNIMALVEVALVPCRVITALTPDILTKIQMWKDSLQVTQHMQNPVKRCLIRAQSTFKEFLLLTAFNLYQGVMHPRIMLRA